MPRDRYYLRCDQRRTHSRDCRPRPHRRRWPTRPRRRLRRSARVVATAAKGGLIAPLQECTESRPNWRLFLWPRTWVRIPFVIMWGGLRVRARGSPQQQLSWRERMAVSPVARPLVFDLRQCTVRAVSHVDTLMCGVESAALPSARAVSPVAMRVWLCKVEPTTYFTNRMSANGMVRPCSRPASA
jgi:hypothetical protein